MSKYRAHYCTAQSSHHDTHRATHTASATPPATRRTTRPTLTMGCTALHRLLQARARRSPTAHKSPWSHSPRTNSRAPPPRPRTQPSFTGPQGGLLSPSSCPPSFPVRANHSCTTHRVTTACIGKHGGNHVELQGSFDNWTQRHVMQRNGRDFMIVKLLPPGVYQVCGPAHTLCTKERLLCHTR